MTEGCSEENAQYIAIRIAIRPCHIVWYRDTTLAAIPTAIKNKWSVFTTVFVNLF